MPVRVECTTPGLDMCWIQVVDVWTRKELQEYATAKGEPFVALWQRKVEAVHLVTVAGDVITEPTEVHTRLDELDLRLISFVTSAVLEATDYLLGLGEVNKRLSFAGGEAARTKTKTPAEATKTGVD